MLKINVAKAKRALVDKMQGAWYNEHTLRGNLRDMEMFL